VSRTEGRGRESKKGEACASQPALAQTCSARKHTMRVHHIPDQEQEVFWATSAEEGPRGRPNFGAGSSSAGGQQQQQQWSAAVVRMVL